MYDFIRLFQYNELQKVVRSVANEITSLIKKERKKQYGRGQSFAPKGVILYFEGLDCSGKSSTGGLVQTALEQAGYNVIMRQYNRPPTAAQRYVQLRRLHVYRSATWI
jgi:signal recognition particle GTPase